MKKLINTLFLAVQIYISYLAVFTGNTRAENIMIFVVTLSFILYLISILNSGDAVRTDCNRYPHTFGITAAIIMLMFASAGWFWLAFAVFFIWAFDGLINYQAKKQEPET